MMLNIAALGVHRNLLTSFLSNSLALSHLQLEVIKLWHVNQLIAGGKLRARSLYRFMLTAVCKRKLKSVPEV